MQMRYETIDCKIGEIICRYPDDDNREPDRPTPRKGDKYDGPRYPDDDSSPGRYIPRHPGGRPPSRYDGPRYPC